MKGRELWEIKVPAIKKRKKLKKVSKDSMFKRQSFAREIAFFT